MPASLQPKPVKMRGPRNRRPRMLRFAALMHVLSRLALFLAVAGAPGAFLVPEPHGLWFLLMPALFVPLGAAWAWSASKVHCRVCGMRMFFHQPCGKHHQAPSWGPLGPHTTMALHALASNEVTCPYCGTPNDLG